MRAGIVFTTTSIDSEDQKTYSKSGLQGIKRKSSPEKKKERKGEGSTSS